MLTSLRRVVVALAACAGLIGLGLPPASAAPVCTAFGDTDPDDKVYAYGCVEYAEGGDDGDDGTDNSGDGGGSTAPQCKFFGIYDAFCQGERACFINDPAAIQDVDEAREADPGLGEKPEDAEYLIYTSCRVEGTTDDDVNTYYWDNQINAGPSLEDRVRAAAGELVLPTVGAMFNPPNRTLVNLDTWFWAEGGSVEEIVGTEALGVRAIATPRNMVVTADSGRESAQITCPVVTEKSDECSLTFGRAGAYDATVTITYDLRFEQGGTAIDLPAGAADLATITTSGSTTVDVVEIQSRVTQLG